MKLPAACSYKQQSKVLIVLALQFQKVFYSYSLDFFFCFNVLVFSWDFCLESLHGGLFFSFLCLINDLIFLCSSLYSILILIQILIILLKCYFYPIIPLFHPTESLYLDLLSIPHFSHVQFCFNLMYIISFVSLI